jgi:hypothetical protein
MFPSLEAVRVVLRVTGGTPAIHSNLKSPHPVGPCRAGRTEGNGAMSMADALP